MLSGKDEAFMIRFDRHILDNGLRVIIHRDEYTPLVAVNVLYDVGSRDEHPDRTGFAHLFEHLMFGGTEHIPEYDRPVQDAGGENNAFTSTDLTNYYMTLPRKNLETAFWLESDRMSGLAFSEKSLEVQRNVVIEEFKQSYLNQPYGDIMLLLRPLAYTVHPYRWNTIGEDISHIENVQMNEVKRFFKQFYSPSNAILSICGNVSKDEVTVLADKWFSHLKPGQTEHRKLPEEPEQREIRTMTVTRDVPCTAIIKAFHMPARLEKDYHACDLISDILSNGKSSRLYNRLFKEKKLFSEINAYISGSHDRGLFLINGLLAQDVGIEEAENALNEELAKLSTEDIEENELQKVKNKVESSLVLSYTDIRTKALNLAIYELLGDASLMNTDILKYHEVNIEDIKRVSGQLFRQPNCSTLYYLAGNKK